MGRLLERGTLHLALLLSGFAALVYETSWTRMLHRVFGVGDLAVATVLAAFFVGLGLGSWTASRRSARLSRPARVYALLEVTVGVYAFASPFVVPLVGQAYTALGDDAGVSLLATWRLALSLSLLVPPTLLMGATLPVVARIVAGKDGWARGVTGLYASNTLGAMLGVGIAGFLLIPRLGDRLSTWIAALASLAAAALVYAFQRGADAEPAEAPDHAEEEVRQGEGDQEEEEAEGEPEPELGSAPSEAPAASLALPIALAAGTGLSALAGEVLWTRVLRTVLHATTQAFSGMLLCYLFGIAIGALVARRLVRTRGGAALALGVTQALMGVLIVLAMVTVPHLVRLIPLLRGALSFVPHRASTILLISGALLLPLALVSGTGLPLVWSLAERGESNAVRGSGRLLAANTLGGGLGSIAAGFVMVPALGVEASLLVVMFAHLVLAGLALRRATAERAPGLRAVALTAPLGLGVAALLLAPSLHLPFLMRAWQQPVDAILHGPDHDWQGPIMFFEEGRASTVTVQRQPTGLTLYNDGRPESGFGPREPGFGPELGVLGGLPVLFGERTERAMVIGLGAGHTASVLLRGGFERVDVVELEEAVVQAARRMHRARQVPFPLDDPRAHLIVDDARNRLVLAEEGSYDAIVSQPSHPWLAGSSALYTVEFFREVDVALRSGGVLSIWLNLFRIQPRHIRAVVRTLREVFAHVQGFVVEGTSLVLSASQQPPQWDERLEERIGRLSGQYLTAFDLDAPAKLAAALELDSEAARELGEGAPLIDDDLPLLEFELASTSESRRVDPTDLDEALPEVPWWSESTAGRMTDRADALTQRIGRVIARPIALDRVELTLPHARLSESDRAFVEGALAEARGDVRGALAAWDRSTRPQAATRADRLRFLEGMPRSALERARDRETGPHRAEALLLAGIELGEARWLDLAARLAREVGHPSERALLDFVEREAASPCSAWSEQPEGVEALARLSAQVAFRAQGCAFGVGDLEAARRLGTLEVRGRRAAAEQAYAIGEGCRVGGAGGCALLMLRRALREYPSHSRSAAALARLLHRGERDAEAREVLLGAMRATEGIAPSQQRLVSTAEDLGIDLGIELPRAGGPSPTSTATGAPAMGD